MPKPHVLICREIFEDDRLKLDAETDAEVWLDQLPMSRAVLLEKARDVDGILSMVTERVDAELMDAAGPQLRVVSQFGVGFDNIDVAEATRRKIAVGNTPDVLTETTADFAFALLMAAARRVVEGAFAVRDGKWVTWHPLDYLGQDVHGSTLGIIGMGRIGAAVAKRARGFDMNVLYADIARREDLEVQLFLTYVDLDTLLKDSDFVSLHTVLTDDTHHLIGERELATMKSTAVLVNASRGPVIDPKALYRALNTGVIRSAALDVTVPEPIQMDDPLLTLDNCIVVPHIASASVATRREMSRIAVQNVLNGVRGEKLLACVNPQVYG